MIYLSDKWRNALLWHSFFNSKKGFIPLSFILGALSTLGFAPFNMWVIVITTLTFFFALLSFIEKTWHQVLATWCFFIALNFSTLGFIDFVMQDFGQIPFYLSYLILFIFSTYLAFPYALAIYIKNKIKCTNNTIAFIFIIPALFVVADFILATLFTGFPWVYVSYSTIDGPLSSFAPLIGAKGINLIIYIMAGCLSQVLRRNYLCLPCPALLLLFGIFTTSISYTKDDKTINVSLVQGNVKQEVRLNQETVYKAIATYYDLSKDLIKKENEIIVWPESAIPVMLNSAIDLVSDLNTIAYENKSILITGIQRFNEKTNEAFNSIVVLGEHKNLNLIKTYDKRHLVPFGEFVPLENILRPLHKIFNFPMSSFTKGSDNQKAFTIKDNKFIPAICYEAIFPELLTSLDNIDSNAILMVSNDAWFGLTRGPQEHLNIARMRSLELQKPMIRATNNGISVIIDKFGKIKDSIAINQESVLSTTVTTVKGQTIYSKFGNVPLYIISLLLFIFGYIKRYSTKDKLKENLEKLVRP